MNTQVSPVLTQGFPNFSTFNLNAFMAHWNKFYHDVYGLTLDPTQIAFPPVEQALGAGVVIAGDFTIEQDLVEIRKRTKNNFLYRYTDNKIDELVQKDCPQKPYAVWAYPATESTDQASSLSGKSYLDIKEMSIPVMIFSEYTRFFLWHLWATGKPLDQKSVTLSGSLDADGVVLHGNWDDDRFYVFWCLQGDSYPSIRARRVVLPPMS